METSEDDDIFKVRKGHNDEKFIQFPKHTKGYYRRTEEDEGKKITFVKV